jgi:hypothetical protein
VVGSVLPIVDCQIVRVSHATTTLDERVYEICLIPVSFATVRLRDFRAEAVGNLLQWRVKYLG